MVIGANTRPIVKSAKKLGMKTIALDRFCDLDLEADVSISTRGFTREELLELAVKIIDGHDVDGALLISGAEHYGLVEGLRKKVKICGNDMPTIRACEDKIKLFKLADELGIPHPRTLLVKNEGEALDALEELDGRAVFKPAYGGGGIGISCACSPLQVEASFNTARAHGDRKTVYVQEYVKGVDASVSVLSNGEEARYLTVNEQIIGDKTLRTPCPFGYCGNVVPIYEIKDLELVADYSELICGELGVKGSNGLDFVLSDKPYLIEINPRFQSTIDCVEKVLSINLVEEHLKACEGVLKNYGKPRGYGAKLILYAGSELVAPDLGGFPIVDVPVPGSIVEGPICSVLEFGKTEKETLRKSYAVAREIYHRIDSQKV